MAKAKSGDGSLNKSQEVRDALARNPTAKPKEIVAELAASGIKVTTGLVYMIKSVSKKKKRRKKLAAAAAISATTPSVDPVKLILKVRDLAREAGGLRYLKQLVDVLAE